MNTFPGGVKVGAGEGANVGIDVGAGVGAGAWRRETLLRRAGIGNVMVSSEASL
jgi:hypothetical protein